MASRRLKRINNLLQQVVGELLLSEADVPNDVLVTVSRVDTTPNLANAEVWLYILPEERSDEIVQHLTPQLYHLQGSLNKELDLKTVPRIRWRIDYGAAHADKIETTLKALNTEQTDSRSSQAE